MLKQGKWIVLIDNQYHPYRNRFHENWAQQIIMNRNKLSI